jgi:hypothetical protein
MAAVEYTFGLTILSRREIEDTQREQLRAGVAGDGRESAVDRHKPAGGGGLPDANVGVLLGGSEPLLACLLGLSSGRVLNGHRGRLSQLDQDGLILGCKLTLLFVGQDDHPRGATLLPRQGHSQDTPERRMLKLILVMIAP